MDQLLRFFNRLAKLSPGLRNHLKDVIEPHFYRKKKIIKDKGEKFEYIYYVEKGLIRAFTDNFAKDRSYRFRKEENFILYIDWDRIPSAPNEILEALEDSLVWGIPRDQVIHTIARFPEFNYHIGAIINHEFNTCRRQLKALSAPIPEDRFQYFFRRERHLLSRIPTKYLASYINVTEDMFELMKQNKESGKMDTSCSTISDLVTGRSWN